MPQSFADQLRSIPMSANLGQSLERAHRSARDQSHRLVTLEHLLLALTEDVEAALILQSANVDLGRLSTDVSGHLGRMLDDMRAEPGAEPRPDAELLRVLQAAASAAQQSRRKQIDGAIVLAAIVGDGKSSAAGLLKALGMTFEEAIRALQRANTKARLRPLAKPTAAALADESPTGAEPPTAEAQPPPAPDTPTAEAPASGAQPLVAQSADEILAAARARIQQRAATKVAKTEPAAAREAPPAPPRDAALPHAAAMDINPEPEPVDPVQTKSLTAAIEAAMASSGSRGTELPLPPPPTISLPAAPGPAAADPSEKTAPASVAFPSPGPAAARPTRPGWTPPPEPRRQPAGRPPQPPLARVPPPPFPARPVPANEGPRRPPLPQRPGAIGQPQPGLPGRAARAPWPEAGEAGVGARPPLANGSLAETTAVAHRPAERLDPSARPSPPPPWLGPAPRGGQSERALLVESVPRRMRVGVPAIAEVRVARDKIDGLIVALYGRGTPQQSDTLLARAVSVRLGAPQGGFWIEPAAPETHWVSGLPSTAPGAAANAQDEAVTWRWTVVPRRSGRRRLTLMVSAHTVSREGVTAQPTPTDRTIEVKVGANHLRRARRLLGWVVVLAAGVFLGRHAQEYWAPALATFKRALAMLGV